MTREEKLHWIDEEIRTWENECQCKHPIKEALHAARKALEQEPCNDAVSVASVFEIIGNLMSIPYDFDRSITEKDVSESMDKIRALPRVTPQEPNTWSLDDAREDFMYDVYNTLDFLPTNDEANQIIDSFDMVTKGIKQEQRWIPVTERLPKEGTFVLASYTSDEGEDVIMTYYNKYGFTRGLMNAWMPLPQPYRAGGEDKE